MSKERNDSSGIALIEKIESKLNSLQNIRLSLLNINTVTELKNDRNDIIRYLFELENDMRNIAQHHMLVLRQNDELLESLKNYDLLNRKNELKHQYYDKDLDDLNMKIKDLINVNRLLNEKSAKDELEIRQLKDSIRLYEEQLYRKQLELDNFEISKKIDPLHHNQNHNLYAECQNPSQNMVKTSSDKSELNKVITDYISSKNKLPSAHEKQSYQKDELTSNVTKSSQITTSQFNPNVQEAFSSSKNENKIGKLVGLLVKIKNSEELKKFCCEKLGKDFMQKILSEKVSEYFLEKVESILDEYYKLNVGHDNKVNSFTKNSNRNNNQFPSSFSNTRNDKSTNLSSNLKFSASEIDDNMKSLRSLKSSGSFSRLKAESQGGNHRGTPNETRNKSTRNPRKYEFRETTSWASLKDYFNFSSVEAISPERKK